MADDTSPQQPAWASDVQTAKWKRRRDIPLAILAWIALVAVALWAASHIIRTILVLAIAALLAFALYPIVKLLQRVMPRPVAIVIVYLVFLGVISFFFYQVASTAIRQSAGITRDARTLFSGQHSGYMAQLEQIFARFGVGPGQITEIRQQIVAWSENFAKSALPLLRNALDFAIDVIVVAVLSIYLLLDGSRAAAWIRHNLPSATRANFLLDVIQQVVGGYIRGQVILSLLIGLLVGLGMGFIFHLPFAVFLGVLAFAVSFIPVIGTFISGAVCLIIGFATHGWLVAVSVLIYFVIIHVIEGEVVGPRIVGKAVGLHPVVSLLALVAGAELFGVWGALFASPIAGVVQTLIIALWTEWKATHPEQFRADQTEKRLNKVESGQSSS
ncbi:MAG TPA: AI-2E family transporter [Ktedonobacteraceae bacterium]|jgi:predicted PurR-regulated permease PerM|nr:AI-2E family transporter [Ktedonobacteraceae bacterium]